MAEFGPIKAALRRADLLLRADGQTWRYQAGHLSRHPLRHCCPAHYRVLGRVVPCCLPTGQSLVDPELALSVVHAKAPHSTRRAANATHTDRTFFWRRNKHQPWLLLYIGHVGAVRFTGKTQRRVPDGDRRKDMGRQANSQKKRRVKREQEAHSAVRYRPGCGRGASS